MAWPRCPPWIQPSSLPPRDSASAALPRRQRRTPVHRAGDESRQPSPTGVQQGGEGTTGGGTTGDQSAAAAADADEALGATEDDQVLQSSHSDLHDAQTEMLFKRGALLPIMWKGIKQPSALLRLLQLGGPPSSAAASSSANTLTTASASSVEAEKADEAAGAATGLAGFDFDTLAARRPDRANELIALRTALALRKQPSPRGGAAAGQAAGGSAVGGGGSAHVQRQGLADVMRQMMAKMGAETGGIKQQPMAAGGGGGSTSLKSSDGTGGETSMPATAAVEQRAAMLQRRLLQQQGNGALMPGLQQLLQQASAAHAGGAQGVEITREADGTMRITFQQQMVPEGSAAGAAAAIEAGGAAIAAGSSSSSSSPHRPSQPLACLRA